MKLLLALIVLAAPLPTTAFAQTPHPVGSHLFGYTDPGAKGPVEIAATAGSRCAAKPCDVVIAMPGLTRNAFQTRDNWLQLAEAHDLLVVSPYLDAKRFPTRLYQQGGAVGEPDRSKWLYATIERLYDHLVMTGRAKPEGYVLFGHSAGAQFVHRMVLLMPEARFRVAVAGNAGFYTLPTGRAEAGGFAYPFSLEDAPSSDETRRKALARPLILMLGDQDTDPNHYQLNNSGGAKAQGSHRFARGEFFFKAAKAEAVRLGTPFNWKQVVVPGVDHDNRRMAGAAAKELFGPR